MTEKNIRDDINGPEKYIYTLIVVAAVAVLVATIWMPVLQIYGASMAPMLNEGDIVISVKGSDFEPGDFVAFYMGNKILVKRCIAGPGQWVDIEADGSVYVDGKLLDEPYLTEKALGDCDIELPYHRWIPAAQRLAVSPMNRLLEKLFSGSGLCLTSEH